MDDFKKVAVGLYELVLEEHAMLAITSLIGSKDAFKRFLDVATKVNDYLVQHHDDFEKAILEVEANEMLNQEIK